MACKMKNMPRTGGSNTRPAVVVFLGRSGLLGRCQWAVVNLRRLDSTHSQSVDLRSMRKRFPSTLNVTGSAVGGDPKHDD